MLLLLQSQDRCLDHRHYTDMCSPLKFTFSIQNQWMGRAFSLNRNLVNILCGIPDAHDLWFEARIRVEKFPVLVLLHFHLHALRNYWLLDWTEHLLECRRWIMRRPPNQGRVVSKWMQWFCQRFHSCIRYRRIHSQPLFFNQTQRMGQCKKRWLRVTMIHCQQIDT